MEPCGEPPGGGGTARIERAAVSQDVELSEELVAAGERVANESGCTAAEQIEFWVRLGRAIEKAVRPETLRELERGLGLLFAEGPE